MCKEHDSVGFGLGILIGVVGGVVAGVLLAPKKGEDSCCDVKCTIENLIKTQAPRVKEAKKQAFEAIDLVKYKLEKAKKLEESDVDYDIN